MNNFEQAVRQQLRFDFRGQISIEQLYSMRISQSLKEELISYEENLTIQKDSFGKSTRRQTESKSSEQKLVELRLNIISSLLDEIEENEKKQKEKANKEEKRQELLALRAKKQTEEIGKLSLAEIDEQLKALDS